MRENKSLDKWDFKMFKKIGDCSPIKVLESEDVKDLDINDFDSKKKMNQAKKDLELKESNV